MIAVVKTDQNKYVLFPFKIKKSEEHAENTSRFFQSS